MIDFLLTYFIGKAFYDLASQHKKHKWEFAISGIAVYYGAVLNGWYYHCCPPATCTFYSDRSVLGYPPGACRPSDLRYSYEPKDKFLRYDQP